MLEIADLVVRFGAKEALKGVNMRFDGGSLGLLGPNGAGKSSLLRAILGLIRPARGHCAALGHDSVREGILVRALSGYMPENDCHIPGLTGLEFTAYCGRLSGLSAGDAKRRAHEVLVYVGMNEERYRQVDGYSRGMKQKVKFAATLVHDPALLFLDEPTNGLDPQARQEILDLIRDLSTDKGVNIILSSHLLQDVESVCREMIVLDDGRVRAAGSIESLKQEANGFAVRVMGNPEPFATLARERGFQVKPDDHGSLLVLDGKRGETLTVHTLFLLGRAAGTPLRHVVPARESLEDLFIRTLEGGKE